MHGHINKSIIIDYRNSFIYMGLAQGSWAQKEFQYMLLAQ